MVCGILGILKSIFSSVNFDAMEENKFTRKTLGTGQGGPIENQVKSASQQKLELREV